MVRMERRMQAYRAEEIDVDLRLDQLRIGKKKLQREVLIHNFLSISSCDAHQLSFQLHSIALAFASVQLRDAQVRITELKTDCGRNQKLIERLKENRLIEMRSHRCQSDNEEEDEDTTRRSIDDAATDD